MAAPPHRRQGRPGAAGAMGQGLVEYGLILALIAIVAVVALAFFGDAIAAALQLIGDEIDRASR